MKNLSQDLYQTFNKSPFKKGEVALLCIDLQYYDTKPGHGFFKNVKRNDVQYKYYFDELEERVIPTVKKMQNLFRAQGEEVIHVKIESLTKDGRDRSPGHKRIGCHVPKGSIDAKFVDEIAPLEDEIVITKTASGVFNSTNIDYVLRNLGIKQLVIVGVVTNECIETAVRDGADKGYEMIVVREGVAAFSEAINRQSLEILNGVYAEVVGSLEIEARFE